MADQNPEVTLALKDANEKLVAMKTERDTARTEAKDAATKLTEATAKLTANEAQLKLKDDELAALRAEKAARVEKDLNDRVERAFIDHKAEKKLTDNSKKTMLIVLKNDATAFEAEYPLIAPENRHLTENLTERSPQRAPNQGAPVVSLRDRARKIAAERKITLEDAQTIALHEEHSA
jgi:hypothetical protein